MGMPISHPNIEVSLNKSTTSRYNEARDTNQVQQFVLDVRLFF
jgi:hypothetical protein